MSIVIAARPDADRVPAADAIQALGWNRGDMEILVARGRQPSVQRNLAVREARGEWIYFLDDDSVPDPGNLDRVVTLLADPAVGGVGGPNLCPPEAPGIERDFAAVLASPVAMGPSRARYAALGALRESSEKELILCNLILRRQPFLDAGGFDETLYPNEENALMDALQKAGWKLMYHPEFIVTRRPRPDLAAFVRMVFRYGRGRAEQVRRNPTVRSVVNFAPACLWLLILAMPWAGAWTLLWLVPYALLVGGDALMLAIRFHRNPARLAPLIATIHLGYGLGFWRGLVTSLKPPSDQVVTGVRIERL